ncbi:MAG TPA: TolC family protein [Flavisolibacter sp.]|jgi:outer membrane protein TolC|nr:TolC family protein [Flavisolibacter sp.]
MKNNVKLLAAIAVLTSSLSSRSQVIELSLQETIALSEKGNRQIQNSRLEASKSEEYTKEIRSYLKPTVSAAGSYTFFVERPVIFLREEASGKETVNAIQVGGRNAFAASITGQYPIYQPQTQSRIQLATIQSEIQKEKTSDIGKSIALKAGELYLTILLYTEQMGHLQSSKERNEQSLKDSRMLFLQGKGLKTDTLSNYIAVKNIEGAIFNLKIKREAATLRLKQLLALAEDQEIILTDRLETQENPVLFLQTDSLRTLAMSNRSDVKQNQLLSQYHQQALKAANAEFKPQVSALAQYQLQSQSDQFSFWKYRVPRTSFIGLQVSIPIYSGNRQKHKSTQIQYSLQQVNNELREIESQINTEVAILKAELEDAYLQKKTQEKNVEAAQVNFTMFQERYYHGLSTRLELTDAELALTQAKINRVQAIYQIRLIELQLQRALGI